MADLATGSVVELKSGGPAMTIESIFTDSQRVQIAKCQWFDGSKALSGMYPLTSLQTPEPLSFG